MTWRNVSGSRSRQLLRNAEHTGAVHWFLGSLAGQARAAGWQVVQLDPPRRASRYFRHDGRLHSVRPDASGVLRRGGETLPFFLEWERRAVRPVTMAARLAPYLRYYSSRRPLDDHGVIPAVLVVFDDDLAATHFLRVARREMKRAGVEVPLRVSHKAALERLGPAGTRLADHRRMGVDLRRSNALTINFRARDEGLGECHGNCTLFHPRGSCARNAPQRTAATNVIIVPTAPQNINNHILLAAIASSPVLIGYMTCPPSHRPAKPPIPSAGANMHITKAQATISSSNSLNC